MLAELEQIAEPRARRQFTRGCLGALALTVPATVGAFFVAGLLSVAVVVAALIRYPALVTGAGTWLTIGFFVAVIAAYVAAAAGLAARLAPTTSTTAVVVAGVAIAGSWMLVGLSASLAPSDIPMTLLVLIPAVAALPGWRATRRSASSSIALHGVGLSSLVAGFGLFLLWAGQTVIFAGRPYDVGMVRDFRTSAAPDLATYAVSDSLGSGMMLLLIVPLVSMAAGATGAMIAARWPHPTHTDA